MHRFDYHVLLLDLDGCIRNLNYLISHNLHYHIQWSKFAPLLIANNAILGMLLYVQVGINLYMNIIEMFSHFVFFGYQNIIPHSPGSA